MIDSTEMDDFQSTLVEYGFDPVEFSVEFLRDDNESLEVYPLTGTVVVRRSSHDAVGRYAAGHGTSWIAEFEQSLQIGQFGPSDD
jgi:hypothetical protein